MLEEGTRKLPKGCFAQSGAGTAFNSRRGSDLFRWRDYKRKKALGKSQGLLRFKVIVSRLGATTAKPQNPTTAKPTSDKVAGSGIAMIEVVVASCEKSPEAELP